MALLKIIEQIKDRRKALHVTQEMLSELSGVGLRTLKSFESGKGNPTLDTLIRLCDVLGMELTLNVKTMNHENSQSPL